MTIVFIADQLAESLPVFK